MTWQLGSFAVLGLALLAGFTWYERARPNARVVALVGTLAAFAALGRIAFAALPNVKPTTDIVLISGYALGGAPGFVVGAVGGLTSNFFFGQGPWTPWQMAAWGATGALGAGLAVVTRRRVGRWPLALVCAAAGFGFAALQDVGDWVNYGDHSAAQLGIYVSKGVGFDLVHALGCLVFALALGPALAHSLLRFGARLRVTWLPARVPESRAQAIRLMLPILLAGTLLTQAAAPAGARAATPVAYLLGAHPNDGGFGPSPGEPSAGLFSGWSALGLAAEGRNPRDVRRGAASALDFIRAGVGSLPDTGALERTILVVRAAGASARSFGGRDLVGALQRQIKSDGSVAGQVNLSAFAVLALRAAAVTPPSTMLSWIARQQSRDGGFSFASGGAGGSDVDDTGAALQALAGASSASGARARAVSFLRDQQNPDGGFPATSGGESNAQSTSWAVQGLLAAGVDPSSVHRGGSVSALAYIRSLVDADGHVRYSRAHDQTPVWVTAEAALALAGKPLPLVPVPFRGAANRHRTAAIATPAAGSAAAGGAGVGVAAGTGAGVAKRTSREGPDSLARLQASALLSLAGDAGMAAALVLAPLGA
jgi:energy-coupling factor transport system substrate-specific component